MAKHGFTDSTFKTYRKDKKQKIGRVEKPSLPPKRRKTRDLLLPPAVATVLQNFFLVRKHLEFN